MGAKPRLRDVPYARRYLAGQSLSVLGDAALWLALGIWVKELTGSSAEAGLSFFFFALPQLAGPLWGTIADRLRRRPLLLAVNLLTAALVMSLLAVHDRHQVWAIWLVMGGYGVSSSLLSAAQSGFLVTLVPDELLGDAQGFLSTAREGLRLLAPFLGAGVFALAGAHVVAVIDAGTFLVAAASLATTRVHEPAPEPVTGHWRREVSAGLAHIRETVPLRQVVVSLALVCLVIGFAETAIFSVVTVGLHMSAPWVAGTNVLMGAGALVGGPTVAMAMRRLGEGTVVGIGIVAVAAGCAALVPATIGTVIAGGVMFGFGLPWVIAASTTLCQRSTPAALQGRVSASVDVLVGTPQCISIALGAALINVVGYQALIGVIAVVSLGAGAWLLTRPEQRRPVVAAADPAAPIDLAVDPPPAGVAAGDMASRAGTA